MATQVSIHPCPPAHLELPASLLAVLREALLELYGSSAETLHFTAVAHLDHRAPVEALLEARARLTQLGETLDQIGWHLRAAPGVTELSAPRDVLLDALKGSLIDARERLAAVWSGADAWPSAPAGVRELTQEVCELQEALGLMQAER